MEPDELTSELTSELTRRLWLLRLGSGIVLTGFSGLDLHATPQPSLPPGLYLPSIDHLAHILKPEDSPKLPPAPLFFTVAEYQQILGLVGVMLGQDSETTPVPEIAAWIDLVVHDAAAVRQAAQSFTPAHRALASAFYGEAAVHELEPFDAQRVCRAGLSRLRAEPSRTLESLEASGDPFIGWLKHRVIEGFYTSEAGLKELGYKGNSFYSVSPGCDQ
jgi:hypothetical protein